MRRREATDGVEDRYGLLHMYSYAQFVGVCFRKAIVRDSIEIEFKVVTVRFCCFCGEG